MSRRGAREIREATIGARDPIAMARRWSEVLGAEASLDNRIALSKGVLHFVKANAEVIVEYGIEIDDPPAVPATLTICGTQFRLS